MDYTTVILGGLVISVTSGTIGKYLGNNNKVTESHCSEKRNSCQKLIIEKIDNLSKKVDDLASLVNSKLLGM